MGATLMPSRIIEKPASPGSVLLLALTLAGCAEQSEVPTTVIHSTIVEVSPALFLQGVPCLEAAGAMRSYVATIWDLDAGRQFGTNDPAPPDPNAVPVPPFALPSSSAVACTQPVGFARVIDGHRYRADIAGYDRPGLEPIAAGVPILHDPLTGERVEPRWTGTCGGEEGVIARETRTRTVGDCTPLVDAAPSELTAVEVRIDSVLGALGCGSEAGQVERFEVEREPGERTLANCGEAVVFDDVSPGATLRLPVFAYTAGSEAPTWGTTCTARAAAGAVVPASCTSLTDRGGIDVDPAVVLASYGLDCSSFLELTLDNPTNTTDQRTITPGNCDRVVRFNGILGGPTAVKTSARDASGALFENSVCRADILPNQAVPAACDLEP
jgi:hypothetical protein